MKAMAEYILKNKVVIKNSKYKHKLKENFFLLKNAIQFGLKRNLDKGDKNDSK